MTRVPTCSQSLNDRLATEVGRCKKNMKKWKYTDNNYTKMRIVITPMPHLNYGAQPEEQCCLGDEKAMRCVEIGKHLKSYLPLLLVSFCQTEIYACMLLSSPPGTKPLTIKDDKCLEICCMVIILIREVN